MSSQSVGVGATTASPGLERSPIDGTRRFLHLAWIEFRRSQGIWLLPLMVALGLVYPTTEAGGDVVLWLDMSDRIALSYIAIGPFVAVLAAWLAGRTQRRRLTGLIGTMPGGGLATEMLAFASAAAWGVAAYSIILVWLAFLGYTRATWGGPEWPLILTGALVIVFLAALGTFIGRVVPGRFAALVALAVTLPFTIMSDWVNSIPFGSEPLQPLNSLTLRGHVKASVDYRDVFRHSATAYIPEQVVWLLGATGVMLAMTAMLRRCRWTGSVVLVLSLLMAGLGAQAEPWTGRPMVASFAWSCNESAGVEVCVHPAYEARLDASTELISALVGPLVGLDGVAVVWKQFSSLPPGANEAVFWEFEPVHVIWSVNDAVFPPPVDEGPVGARPAVQLVIISWLAQGAGYPVEDPWQFGWPVDVTLTPAKEAEGSSISTEPDEDALAAIEPEFRAALDRFTALPEAERRAWLEANWSAIRAGTITLDQMP